MHVLVRGSGLSNTMSRYLIRRIEENPNIALHNHSEMRRSSGQGAQLAGVVRRRDPSGLEEQHDIRHVFLMTGAVPNTAWLNGCVALDAEGIK